ncbi:34756_t:CDS:1, partial [Racocetra persica]
SGESKETIKKTVEDYRLIITSVITLKSITRSSIRTPNIKVE